MTEYICNNNKCKKKIDSISELSRVIIYIGNSRHEYELCEECATNIIKKIEEDNKPHIDKKENIENKLEIEETEKIDNTILNNNSIPKRRAFLKEQIKEYGKDKMLKELEDNTKTSADFAELFGVKENSFKTFLYKNNIVESKKYSTNKVKKVKKETETTEEKIKKTNKLNSIKEPVVNGDLKEERKDLERTVELTNGICLSCGYRDRDGGICGYSIITGKHKSHTKNECKHFVDRGDIK